MEERKRKIYTGITLDPDVAACLASIAEDSRSNRSQIINEIVRTFFLNASPLKMLKIADVLKERSRM